MYWGGETAERICLWNFHVSKASSGETRVTGETRPFDEGVHKPVNLTREKIRVVVQLYWKKYEALRDGNMTAQEGSMVYLEEIGLRNRKVLTPILLPRRERINLLPGTVIVPA